MADKIRVGIVGATVTQGGSHWGANAHVPALQSLPNYQLKAVCTSREDTAKASAQAFGAEQSFTRFSDMAAHPDVDLLVVCVRVPGHRELVMAGLQAGKPVFCEWPLGANLAEAEEMAGLARQRSLKSMVGLQGRSDPTILYARDRLLPAVRARLKQRTGLESFFYGNFTRDEGRTENGWITYTHHPRFGSNYRGLTNRMDVLLETYSYLEFEQRVRTTYEFLVELLAYTAEHGREMVEIVETSQHPPEKVAVRYRLETLPEPVEILTREPRTLEGAPASVVLPHYGRFTGAEVVARPWGYALSSDAAAHLRQDDVPQRANVPLWRCAHTGSLRR